MVIHILYTFLDLHKIVGMIVAEVFGMLEFILQLFSVSFFVFGVFKFALKPQQHSTKNFDHASKYTISACYMIIGIGIKILFS